MNRVSLNACSKKIRKFEKLMFIYHLESGKIFLPPKKTLNAWSQGSQAVIRVHHRMNNGIEQWEEIVVIS